MMKRLELSPRLQAVADLVPEGARLADIGTDHAYLPVSLLLEGRIPSAIAADLRKGPLDRARITAMEYGCTDRMSFRLCDGLKDIAAQEADAIAIAGMGGETITAILSAAEWVKGNNLPVVLQPMSSQPELRRWLWQNEYDIRRERIVREGETLYVIILAVPGRTEPMALAQEWAGRQYKGMQSPLRGAYLEFLLEKVTRALDGIARSREGIASFRYQELEQVRLGLMEMREEWNRWQQ